MVVAVMKQGQQLERGFFNARSRDRELVALVSRHGLMRVEQVQEAMGCGRTATYRRLARCQERGWIERRAIAGLPFTVLLATRSGLGYAGIGLPVASVSPALVTHMLRCTSVGVGLERKHGSDRRVLTEREIILEETISGEPVASVPVGSFRGRPKMHRADLAVEHGNGLLAVEVELTPKSPARLRRIVKAWAGAVRAGHLAAVCYLCEPGQTYRAVERAIASVGAEGLVAIQEVAR
jgi:hypothetical protein